VVKRETTQKYKDNRPFFPQGQRNAKKSKEERKETLTLRVGVAGGLGEKIQKTN